MEFFKKLINTIIEVEDEYKNTPKAGSIKKEKVIRIMNKLVNIPVIPEFMEERIFSIIIDLIIYIFNEYGLFPDKIKKQAD